MMRSPLKDIGRLQQQGFKYTNITHAHDRLLAWETWFKTGQKAPPPSSTPAPNQDAAAMDKLVHNNSEKIISAILHFPREGLKANAGEVTHLAQLYMISPIIVTILLRMADELAATGGASVSNITPSLSPPSSNRFPTVSSYQAFLDKLSPAEPTDSNQLPKAAARATPQAKATQPAPKVKPAPRSSPDR